MILEHKHTATGTKILLASMEKDHVKHLIKLAQNPSLSDVMGWDTFFEHNQVTQFLDAIAEYALPYSQHCQPIIFGIYLQLDEPPIGYAILKGINKKLLTTEVGVAILEPRYQNKGGYGRLALARIIMYAFDELQLNIVAAAILSSNKRSINMCKRVGFTVRKILPQSWEMPDGHVADMTWLELTRDTYLNP